MSVKVNKVHWWMESLRWGWLMKWMKMNFRVQGVKMLLKSNVHRDGFKPINFLEWRSAVASARQILMWTWWSNWKKDLRFSKSTFSNLDGNLSLMRLYNDYSNTKCAFFFNYILRAKVAQSIIPRDRDIWPPSSFNCKSMIRGAVGSDDLVLWWYQRLLQV